MKTTLNIDPDVTERLLQATKNGRQSLEQVVNEYLRIGLGLNRSPSKRPYKVKAHSSPYQPGVYRSKLNQIVEEMEVKDFISQ
jgi:hypothetical protein